MTKYVIRRLLQVIPTLWGVFTILFVIAYLMPGDPLRAVLGEQYHRLEPSVVEAARDELGLNDPFHVRYLDFLGQMLSFDLGYSFILKQPVIDVIGYRLPRTIQLMSGGLLVGVLIGVTAGVLAAERQNTWTDYGLMIVALIGVSIPVFWQGLLAQLFLTQDKYGIALFPVAGYEGGSISHMILPSLVLGTSLSATLARVTRSAMLEVRGQDYVRTARAKGLPWYATLMRHQFRNALIPIITVIALDISGLFTGSIVTETIFSWPGLGRAVVVAIERRDTPVFMGILVFGALVFILINLITDLLYAVINPRIRYE
ncbi:MAG: ABC transporter permease [Anaerolineae bacterium]|nr:ABC transporter permease [Anaerolineae bacterium]